MSRSAGGCGWLLGLVAACMLPSTLAQALDALYGGEHYQRELLYVAKESHGLEADPTPEGKVIERIVTVPYDVFLADDPYPRFLNWFHITTLPRVIERELLFKAGDRWSNELIAESARNIRTYLFVSVARVIATRGSSPDKVVALVVTKDTWSLRTNAEFQLVGRQLQYLDAQLTEENLIGRRKRATIDLGLNPAIYYAGIQYRDPRVLSSNLYLIERGDLFWNRTSGVVEGGVANISIQEPLYTLDTPWAWKGDLKYRKDIQRLFTLGEVAQVRASATGELIAFEYNRHQLDLELGFTRSMGRERKRNYSFGYRSFVHLYSTPAQAVQIATLREFEASILPLSESAGLVYAGFHTYRADYRELLDIQSFAVTEDQRLGLDLSAELRLADPWLGFSSRYLQPVVNAAWSSYASDNLFVASGGVETRYQPQLTSASPWVNGHVTLGVRNVTPKVSVFRLHTSLIGGRRFNDFNHDFKTLGGESSLRGYPVAYLIGANYWNGNAEIRTAPIAWSTVHLGLAAFFDVGGASNDVTRLSPHASAGGGLRIGLPQFNREIFRIDFGFPLETLPANKTPSYFVAQYGQAF